MILFLLFACEENDNNDTSSDSTYEHCPDVQVTCPEPVINLTCPEPVIENIIQTDCPDVEITCPEANINISNEIDTQPIADVIDSSSSSPEYYAETVAIPTGSVEITVFTNTQSTDFIITHLWTKGGTYGGADCWRAIQGVPSYTSNFTLGGSWRNYFTNTAVDGLIGVGLMADLTMPLNPTESLICSRGGSTADSYVYFQGYWQ